MPDLLSLLADKALDVDPDLRFMALEDLRKHLNDPKVEIRPRQVEKFVPILFRLLHDSNPNVQSQAVKTFAPVAQYVEEKVVLNMLTKLYDEVEKENSDGRITTSIPSMALHNILASDHRLEPQLARKIIHAIIPAIFSKNATIDSMELLIDIVSATGFVIEDSEILDLLVQVIDIVFRHDGMLGTRAAVALQELLSYLNGGTTQQIIHQLTVLVNGHEGDIQKKLSLFSIILKHNAPHDAIQVVRSAIQSCVSLQNDTDLENIDLDVVARDNSIRASALTTLADMVSCVSSDEVPVDECIDVVVKFANYDPLSLNDSDEEEEYSDMSDLEFEDDGDQEFESDDGSWRMRLKACNVAKNLVLNVPSSVPKILQKCLDVLILAMTGSSEAVAHEAIGSVTAALNTPQKTNPSDISKIEKTTLALITKPDLMHHVLELVIALAAKNVSSEFWDHLFDKLGEQSNTEYWRLYRAVLSETEPEKLSTNVVETIAKDVAHALQASTMHYVLTESLTIASLLLHRHETTTELHQTLVEILDVIIAKCGDRQYSSDLRQSLISTLCEYLSTIETSESQQEQCSNVLLAALGYEATMRTVLASSGPIFQNANLAKGQGLQQFAVSLGHRLQAVLASPDQTYHGLSLQLLATLTEELDADESKKAVSAVVEFGLRTEDSLQIAECFAILEKANVQLGEQEVLVIAQLALKVDEEYSVKYFRKLASCGGNLFSVLKTTLKDRPRLLAAVAVLEKDCDIFEKVGQIDLSDNQLEMSLKFLGWAAFYGANVPPATFFDQLNNSSAAIKTAAASALGLVISKELESHIDTTLNGLLQAYQNHPSLHTWLLVAFRPIPTKHTDYLQNIWTTIWNTIWSSVATANLEKQLGELRQAGEILALACDANGDLLDREYLNGTDAEIYVDIAVLKQLLTKLHSAHLLEKKLVQVMPAIKKMSIEIKQAMIGTFLTAIHRRIDVADRVMDSILLAVYGELDARDEFKKTIPMGPYKYVIDEGLEIRKLCYELLYTVAGHENRDHIVIAHHAISHGLIDNEPDVVMLACGVVRRCAAGGGDNDSVISEKSFVTNHSVVSQLIANIRVLFAKKVRPKASAQETETFETMIRTVVLMSNDVNTAMQSSVIPPEVQLEWNRFFHEVETRM